MSHRPPQSRTQVRQKLTVHRGLATWGERLVPLEAFREAARRAGRPLPAAEREAARRAYLAPAADPTPVEGPFRRIALFGGVYSNHPALAALVEDARRRGAEALYCLGDLGAFGPNPEKVRPLLDAGGVRSLQGNYEESLAAGAGDCNCGYTDPRDNHFAGLSYRYTAARSSDGFKAWMGTLPKRRRVLVGGRELLLVHGSPRRVNEFLFESATPAAFLDVLLDQERADALLFTHTGLHWRRRLPSGRDAVNVGVIGRPANDGRRNVWYTMVEATEDDGREAGAGGAPTTGRAARGSNAEPGPPSEPGKAGNGSSALKVGHVPLAYDWRALAAEMRAERLPEEFVETIETGWWTTCLEVLPARERAASRF